jgi:uncharacterized protein (TIGR02001 family)
MQNYCKTIGALAAASALVAGNASAEVEYELHTGYTNQYLFRGVDLGDNLVEVGADVATKWNGVGLSAGAWQASYDSTGLFGTTKSTTELDLYAEASYDLGFATGAVGYIKYINKDDAFLGTIDDAQEVYFSLSRDLGFAQASLTYFWDIETDNNGYSELALSKDIELTKCLSLGLSSALGYAVEEGAFANWTTKVALNWSFAENAKLSPFVMLAIGGDVDSGYKSDNQNEFVGGSMLSVSF